MLASEPAESPYDCLTSSRNIVTRHVGGDIRTDGATIEEHAHEPRLQHLNRQVEFLSAKDVSNDAAETHPWCILTSHRVVAVHENRHPSFVLDNHLPCELSRDNVLLYYVIRLTHLCSY